jgi:hypothetical protein
MHSSVGMEAAAEKISIVVIMKSVEMHSCRHRVKKNLAIKIIWHLYTHFLFKLVKVIVNEIKAQAMAAAAAAGGS